MNITPGILATNPKELIHQLKKVTWAKKLHIDVMDGSFVPNKTVQPITLKKYLPNTALQIHLMTYHPHRHITPFARMGAKDFIIHAEATKHPIAIIHDIKKTKMNAGIAFNPQTKISRYKKAIKEADIALIMTVQPGYSGQQMIKAPLKKIKELRKINPRISIGIDGGITEETICFAQPANFVIATGALTLAKDPKKAYARLKKSAKRNS